MSQRTSAIDVHLASATSGVLQRDIRYRRWLFRRICGSSRRRSSLGEPVRRPPVSHPIGRRPLASLISASDGRQGPEPQAERPLEWRRKQPHQIRCRFRHTSRRGRSARKASRTAFFASLGTLRYPQILLRRHNFWNIHPWPPYHKTQRPGDEPSARLTLPCRLTPKNGKSRAHQTFTVTDATRSPNVA